MDIFQGIVFVTLVFLAFEGDAYHHHHRHHGSKTHKSKGHAVKKGHAKVKGHAVHHAKKTHIKKGVTKHETKKGQSSGFKSNEMCQCTASGDPHYYTFDKQRIDFQGVCKYTLTKTKSDRDRCAFNVEVKNEHRGKNTAVSYTRLVDVKIKGDTIRLHQQKKTYVNKRIVNLPYTGKGYKIFLSGNNVRVETDCHVLIEWNGNLAVTVSVPAAHAQNLIGLCGSCNGKKDDLKTKNGDDVSKRSNYPDLIGDSYKVKDDSDKPEKHCKASKAPKKCTNGMKSEAAKPNICGHLKPSSKSKSPFKDCITHDANLAQAMYDNCLYDYCTYKDMPVDLQDAICDANAAFAERCELEGFEVKWRTRSFCPLQCPENMIFSTSVSGCPASCANLHSEKECDLPRTEGCACKNGFVLSGDTCVSKSHCGCELDNGKYYPVGSGTTSSDCSTTQVCKASHGGAKFVTVSRNARCPAHSMCLFSDGEYQCVCDRGHILDVQRNTCKRTVQENCKRSGDCHKNGECVDSVCHCKKGFLGDGVKNCEAMCICDANGDPHYRTYDRQLITYQGTCKYTLTKSTTEKGKCAFNIEVKNYIIGGTKEKEVSYTRLVDVKIGGDTIRLHLQKKTYVNGKLIKLPYKGKGYRIFDAGRMMRLESDCDIFVEWNGNHVASVAVPKKYANKMTGICGDCNGKKDDLKTKDKKDVSKQKNAENLVVESYAVKDDSDQPNKNCKAKHTKSPCKGNLRTKAAKMDVCGALNPGSKRSSPFKACIEHDSTMAKEMYENCQYDFCAYAHNQEYVKKAICNSVAAFAEQCELNQYAAKWRRDGFCNFRCGTNMKFSYSVSGCPATCKDLTSELNCKLPNTEGCKCIEGYVFDHHKCIHASQCR